MSDEQTTVHEEFYTIPEPQQPDEPKPDPIAKAFEMIAKTQSDQAQILSKIAEKTNTPVTVYQQPQAQVVADDPIQTMQNSINSATEQLNQMLENGDIDRDQYYQKYERLIAPQKEALREAKFNRQIESTKSELTKGYEERFAEQKKALDDIYSSNRAKSEQEKIMAITRTYPDATVAGSPLFKEMEAVLADPAMSRLFTNPNDDKDQYLALAKIADANLKAKGQSSASQQRGQQSNFASVGNPGVYQEQGTKTTFTADQISLLKGEFAGITNEQIMRLSDYNSQVASSNSVTITDWLTSRV